MTQSEKFEFLISSLIAQYEALNEKESTTAKTLKYIIEFAQSIK
jgi:hypothetical protein